MNLRVKNSHIVTVLRKLTTLEDVINLYVGQESEWKCGSVRRSKSILESFSEFEVVGLNLGILLENGLELRSPWSSWVFPDVGKHCDHAAIGDRDKVSSDEWTTICGELGLHDFECGNVNSLNNALMLFHSLFWSATTTAHLEGYTSRLVEHIHPSI